MIKSSVTKVRISTRKKARSLFDKSTREGREAYKEYLRGLITTEWRTKNGREQDGTGS